MTSDDQMPGTGALTRRELRRRADPVENTLPATTTARAVPAVPEVPEVREPEAPETRVLDVAAPQEPESREPETPQAEAPLAEEAPAETPQPEAPETRVLNKRELHTHQPQALQAETPETPQAEIPETRPIATLADIVDDSPSELWPSTEGSVEWADADRPATALAWIDELAVADATVPADLDAPELENSEPDLLAGARLRPGILRPRTLVPLGLLTGLVGAYCATTLLWPLHEVPPTIESVAVETTVSEAATLTWPAVGSAGVSIAGISSAASSTEAVTIASITKVVSSLMVLDRMPLQLGEQGPEFAFTYGDNLDYWSYRSANQSALDVPVGGVLTEYQLLQGILIGSANNYTDRLVQEIWGSDQEFARAAETWLAERGLSGITVMTPSGFDERNVATPEALLALGERAMQNPVFAEIVGTPSVDLPGAGTVTNTNGMLADPGVVGIKTGTLDGWNLLTAKDVVVGDTTVHVYAAVLHQVDDEQRLAVTRTLFSEVEAALQSQPPAVAAGTVVGEVKTPWGASVDVVTDADADVVLWNAATAQAEVGFSLSDHRESGDEVGALTVTGPVKAVDVGVSLAEDIPEPSAWWRLTHPLELLGITEPR